MPTQLSDSDLKDIAEKINEGIDELSVKTLKDKPRTHLGISEIGEPCMRQLYYKFRWVKFEEFDGRMLRLFKRGHREEERFINYLEGIGCKVQRFDENGKQFRVSSVMGHYGGSCDGIGITPWSDEKFLLEFKTHNSKSFIDLLNKGIHKSKPKHFAQMSGYAYHMNIKYGIYFPENKNDDDIKVEVVRLDWLLGRQLEIKANEIITAKDPPAKISENPAYWECKFCTFLGICHQNEIPQKNCRSCRSAVAIDNAEWLCSRYNSLIPKDFIAKGCENWNVI